MSNLLLIPTELELRFLRHRLTGFAGGEDRCGQWSIGLCGFGLVAAAARAAMLIAQERPEQVLLVGIAGALDEAVTIGSAQLFDRVLAHGVGVGEGTDYLSAVQMGWYHWPGSDGSGQIADAIDLIGVCPRSCGPERSSAAGATLLSVCAASANQHQAQQRQMLYPEAVAEDMEGFGVAVACALAGVSLRIVRGISNRAGDRELSNWQIDSSLAAAAILVNELIEQTVESK
jgi:futalosine hydrolase